MYIQSFTHQLMSSMRKCNHTQKLTIEFFPPKTLFESFQYTLFGLSSHDVYVILLPCLVVYFVSVTYNDI